MKTEEKIQRIVYWWRRYRGVRNEEYGKVWTDSDIDLLERRLIAFWKNPKKFDFNNPNVKVED